MMQVMEEDSFSLAAQEVERSGQKLLQGLVRHGIMASDGANVAESNVGCLS
jgi:hypothetical protein